MARYKYIDTHPRFLAVDLARQLLPGTFEHALNHLLDHAIDLSSFDARFRNDTTGAPAYPPATLLKVVLFAYAQGIVSSRGIERACEEHVTFIALCGARTPHFTTIAHFVSTVGPEIARIFAAVVAICDAQGLIGREMFAIDGVKLPSNASKQLSGTRAEFERQAEKLEAAATTMVERHRTNDALPVEPDLATKAERRLARLQRDAAELRDWLAKNPEERRGPTGARQVAFFRGRAAAAPPTHTAQMKQRIDSPTGRAQYGQRFAIVEPVFANLRHNKGLNRFTLRGRAKVEAQWRLFCLVHNIEKLAHAGYAA